MTQKKPEFLLFLGALVLCFLTFADRYLKYQAQHHHWATNNLFGLHYFENTGIMAGIAIPVPVILLTSVLVVLGLLYWIKQRTELHWKQKLSILAILFGGISNFYDRFTYGFVIDYVKVHNAIINIADILIVTGLIALITYTKRTK